MVSPISIPGFPSVHTRRSAATCDFALESRLAAVEASLAALIASLPSLIATAYAKSFDNVFDASFDKFRRGMLSRGATDGISAPLATDHHVSPAIEPIQLPQSPICAAGAQSQLISSAVQAPLLLSSSPLLRALANSAVKPHSNNSAASTVLLPESKTMTSAPQLRHKHSFFDTMKTGPEVVLNSSFISANLEAKFPSILTDNYRAYLNEKFGWINWYLVGKFVKTDGSAFDLFDEMSKRGSDGTMEASQMKKKSGWCSSLRDLISKLKIMEMEHTKLSDEALAYKKCLADMNGMKFPNHSTLNPQVNLHNDLKPKFIKGANEQSELYNKVLELKGNIRIFSRCRHLNTEEVAAMAIDIESAKEGELNVKSNGVTRRTFKFDALFGPQVEQADVFEDTREKPLQWRWKNLYNVCIFAYGQTGGGKTFTMEGTEEAREVNFRTLQELFRVGAGLAEAYSVTCCAVAYFEASGAILCLLMQHLSSNIPHSGMTLIHHAILCNNERAVEVLISCGTDVEVPIQTTKLETECPVHMASRLGLNKILQRLISAGCNINSQTESGETTLMTCARYKHQECLKILASDCADFGLENCLGQSASVIAESSRWALGFRQAVVDVLWSSESVQSNDTSEFSLVMLVTQANDVETLKKLIVGADVDLNEQDEKGYSAAMVAAEAGYLEIFKLLIDTGANINLQNQYGQMILELFVTNQNSEEFEKLFLKNAAPQKVLDSPVEFYGTLHQAVQHGDADFVLTLVSKGSNVIASEANGYTPLLLATRGCSAMLCELLITLEAKCNVVNARHETILLLARKIGIKNYAENVILDELARSIVLGGCCVKKHTKCGRGSPHRKVLKMVGATEIFADWKYIQLCSIFLGGFMIAFVQGWRLTVVLLATIPVIVIAGAIMATIMSKMSSRGQSAYVEAGNMVEQTVGFIRIVAAFTGEKQAIEKYNQFFILTLRTRLSRGRQCYELRIVIILITN